MMAETVSAIVVIRPASGGRIVGGEPISSKNLAESLPSPDAVVRARAYFARNGFQLYPTVAVSFNIAAGARKFEEEFGVCIDLAEGYPRVRTEAGEFAFELPLDRLPASLRDVVEAVAFEEPAEMFGGTAG